MKGSIDKAKNDGIIKSVDDIKLTDEEKMVFKEGIAYDAFDDVEQGIFAVKQVEKIGKEKMMTQLLERKLMLLLQLSTS